MKAYEARARAYETNKNAKGLKDIYKKIANATELGKFNIEVFVHEDWGRYSELASQLKEDGYIVKHYDKQTSPNDSDDFLIISWGD